MSTENIINRIRTEIDSEQFWLGLITDISKIEKPEVKAKLKLALIDYIHPKVRPVDAEAPDKDFKFTVIYEAPQTDDSSPSTEILEGEE